MAVESFGRATKWAALENQSIIVRIVVLPAEGGSPVMKSREVWDHGRPGLGRAWSNPDGDCLESLFGAQVMQAVTYSLVSFASVGYQK